MRVHSIFFSVVIAVTTTNSFAQTAAPARKGWILSDADSIGITVRDYQSLAVRNLIGAAGAGAGGVSSPTGTGASNPTGVFNTGALSGNGSTPGIAGTTSGNLGSFNSGVLSGAGGTISNTGMTVFNPNSTASMSNSNAGNTPNVYTTGSTSDGALTLSQLSQTVRDVTVVSAASGAVDLKTVAAVDSTNTLVQRDTLKTVGVDAFAPLDGSQVTPTTLPRTAGTAAVATDANGQTVGTVTQTVNGPVLVKPNGETVALTPK